MKGKAKKEKKGVIKDKDALIKSIYEHKVPEKEKIKMLNELVVDYQDGEIDKDALAVLKAFLDSEKIAGDLGTGHEYILNKIEHDESDIQVSLKKKFLDYKVGDSFKVKEDKKHDLFLLYIVKPNASKITCKRIAMSKEEFNSLF